MIFKTKEQDVFFQKNGYLVLDFYSTKQIDELINQFQEINPNLENDYFSTIDSSIEIKYKINLLLKSFFEPFIESTFLERKYIFGAFTIKKSGDLSVKPSHQDWSFVDENKSQGIGLWCPLIDVNEKNGALGVLPGSHKYFFNIRGTGTRTEYETVSQFMESKVFKFLKMKKGQVLIFDNRIIHFSKPNLTTNKRIVAGCATANTNTQLFHFVAKENGLVIQKRIVSPNFFIEQDFSKIEFEESQNHEEFVLPQIDLISKKQLFNYIVKNDTRFWHRIGYFIKSKISKE